MALGPVEVPVMRRPVPVRHHPQAEAREHEPQSEYTEHGSVGGAVQALAVQAQHCAQVAPPVGPASGSVTGRSKVETVESTSAAASSSPSP